MVAAGDEGFDLDEEQIAALRESIDEADRGELVPLAAAPGAACAARAVELF